MTRLISDTYPRARKPHHCALCCRTIREGETYRRVCVAQVTPQLVKWCAHCNALVAHGDFDCDDEGVAPDTVWDADPRDWTEARWLVQWRRRWTRRDGALYPVPCGGAA